MGDEGPKGYSGPPGPAGPPGPPGDTGGFDAAQLSQIFGNQNKGPSQADDPNSKIQGDKIQVCRILLLEISCSIEGIFGHVSSHRQPRHRQPHCRSLCLFAPTIHGLTHLLCSLLCGTVEIFMYVVMVLNGNNRVC